MGSKQRWLDNRKRALDYLVAHFPKSIVDCKPLKVGVLEDIRQIEDDGKPALMWFRRALAFHTSRKAYLKKLKAGEYRLDLAGNPAGKVTEQEEENALNRLSKLKKNVAPRVKTEQTKTKSESEHFRNSPVLKFRNVKEIK